MIDNNLEKNIIQTLAYFDIFDYPLTKEELYQYVLNTNSVNVKIPYTNFLCLLDKLKGQNVFSYNNGYYFLNNRNDIIDSRQKTIRILEEKMKIAKKGIRKIRYVPFVKAVFVCNTVASGFVTEESDIDLFIIVRKNRLWLARFFTTIILNNNNYNCFLYYNN